MNKLFLLIAILLLVATVSAQHITLDHTNGTYYLPGTDTYKIYPDSVVDFLIRINDDLNGCYGGLAHGFQIYTKLGNPFTPVTGDTLPTYCWACDFDGVKFIGYFSADGLGADTIGFGFANFLMCGLRGLNDTAFIISSGNVMEWDTLCIDSSFFPPTGTWFWGSSAGIIIPSWDGPHCFESALPPPTFTKYVDTLVVPQCCCPYSFDFEAVASPLVGGDVSYQLINGPGSIDPVTGVWTYQVLPSDYGTEQDITILASDSAQPSHDNQLTFHAVFSDSYLGGDIDYSCQVDIADMIYYINYSFSGGPAPVPVELADIDKNGTADISDLVFLVNYMFNGGPPPS